MKRPLAHLFLCLSLTGITAAAADAKRAANTVVLDETGVKNLRIETVEVEETDFEAVGAPIAVALLYDPGALSWEVVHTLEVTPSSESDATHAWEHAERRLVRPGEWPEPLCRVARAMCELIPRPGQPRR